VKGSVARLFVGQQLDSKPLFLLAVASFRIFRLEVDWIDILPMLPATRILVRAEPTNLFLADPVFGRVGYELVTPSCGDACSVCTTSIYVTRVLGRKNT
jgi:hypothetical protein